MHLILQKKKHITIKVEVEKNHTAANQPKQVFELLIALQDEMLNFIFAYPK